MLIISGSFSLHNVKWEKKKISLLSVLLSLVLHATGTNADNLVAAFYYRTLPSALSGGISK